MGKLGTHKKRQSSTDRILREHAFQLTEVRMCHFHAYIECKKGVLKNHDRDDSSLNMPE